MPPGWQPIDALYRLCLLFTSIRMRRGDVVSAHAAEVLAGRRSFFLYMKNAAISLCPFIYLDQIFIRIVRTVPVPLKTTITILHVNGFEILSHRNLPH